MPHPTITTRAATIADTLDRMLLSKWAEGKAALAAEIVALVLAAAKRHQAADAGPVAASSTVPDFADLVRENIARLVRSADALEAVVMELEAGERCDRQAMALVTAWRTDAEEHHRAAGVGGAPGAVKMNEGCALGLELAADALEDVIAPTATEDG